MSFRDCRTSAGVSTDELALYDAQLAGREDSAKVDDALALEAMIRDADPRIVNSSGSHYADAVSILALANSSGFAEAYTLDARKPFDVARRRRRPHQTDRALRHGRAVCERFGRLVDRCAHGRETNRRDVRRAQAADGELPVIFERDVAAAVLDDLFAAISAANVAIGNSWLAERVGDRVGSELVTIVDDGTLPGRLGSSPFDGEGVPTRRTTVFERGVLRTFLYDTYYARKLGAQSHRKFDGRRHRPQ